MEEQHRRLHRERHRGSELTLLFLPSFCPTPFSHSSLAFSSSLWVLRRRSERDLVWLLSLRPLSSSSLLSPRTQERSRPRHPYPLSTASPLGHVSSLDSKPRRPATATETYIGPFSFFSTHILSFSPSFSQLLRKKVSYRARPYLVVMGGSKEAGRGHGGGDVRQRGTA